MKPRKSLLNLHLVLGLISGAILSVVGITGSLYVFEPELNRLLQQDTYVTKGKSSLFANDIAIARYIEKATAYKIHSLQWPQRGRDTYAFKLKEDPAFHFLDQTTGKITYAHKAAGNSVFGFILDLHTTLTLGETGRYLTGISAVLFAFFMLTTGVYLWWPRNRGRIKSSFKIRWQASPKRVNYDVHNVTGFYFFIPLFLTGFTGGYFLFTDEYQYVIDKITFSAPLPAGHWDNPDYAQTGPRKAYTIYQALELMDHYHITLHRRNLWLPDDADGFISLAYQKYNQVHAGGDSRIFLKVDQYTGEVLSEYDPQKLPLGASLVARWMLPVHFGEFGGIITRLIWFVAGFLPALLFYTGIKIWLGRKKKKATEKQGTTAIAG